MFPGVGSGSENKKLLLPLTFSTFIYFGRYLDCKVVTGFISEVGVVHQLFHFHLSGFGLLQEF